MCIRDRYGRNAYDGGLRIYHQGFSVVDFLIARGGSLWIGEFLKELVATNNINQCFMRYYGYKNISELQSDWIDYVITGPVSYTHLSVWGLAFGQNVRVLSGGRGLHAAL